jgi:superfamily II DNA/RNA helicase
VPNPQDVSGEAAKQDIAPDVPEQAVADAPARDESDAPAPDVVDMPAGDVADPSAPDLSTDVPAPTEAVAPSERPPADTAQSADTQTDTVESQPIESEAADSDAPNSEAPNSEVAETVPDGVTPIPIVEGPPPEPPRPMFADLGLSEDVLRAVAEMGYRHPTPIQEQAIPFVLMGRDVLGTAQTGTGKTASFTLPMLDILAGSRARARMPRSLILEPTRELALQVAENFVRYGKYLKLTHALIIGGESMTDQKEILNRGVDVLIATPGRLLDMFDRGSILLSDTRLLVIDEADRMLDMGFIPDVERIVTLLPTNRQTLFFSATMGPEIRRLADAFLQNPKEIAVARPASVATTITEGLALVAEHDKREALRRLLRTQNVQNALIFCNRKRDVDILYKSLTKHRFNAGALHGDMAQTLRFSTLEKFKANDLQLLVCSDVAARGIDIGGLSHVFNFDVPIHAEDYVHRIGRTGRAGLEGRAFTIAMPDDRYHVEQIEKLIGHPIPPLTVEGLDPIDWSETDGRKRRRKSTGKKTVDRKPEKKTSEKRRDPKTERPATPRHTEPEAEPRYEETRRPLPPRREDRRERYRREEDLGPAIVGFGDDVPAFMFLRARRASVVAETQETDA